MRKPSTSSYLTPPPGYRFRPPWYTRPEFYVPITVAAFILGGLSIFVSMNIADLKNQAAVFDLNKLEQMESASVILDRNGKIFGQIYVENRQTIPYNEIPRNLVNAVVAVEDARFYEHHGFIPHEPRIDKPDGRRRCRLSLDRQIGKSVNSGLVEERSFPFTGKGTGQATPPAGRRCPR